MYVSIGVCEEGAKISNRRIYMIWRKTCWMAVGFIYMHFCVYGESSPIFNRLLESYSQFLKGENLTNRPYR